MPETKSAVFSTCTPDNQNNAINISNTLAANVPAVIIHCTLIARIFCLAIIAVTTIQGTTGFNFSIIKCTMGIIATLFYEIRIHTGMHAQIGSERVAKKYFSEKQATR